MRTRLLALPLLLLAAGPALAEDRWPSLAEQLARDRVPAGSALARLIAENQQLDLLRPEEAGDKMGVPPWLRVLWRKKHPQAELSSAGGTGGYPLVIKEIHEWMVRHPDLRPAEAATPASSSPAKASSGPDVEIAGVFRSAESDIRVNPWDPSRIISSANNLSVGNVMLIFYSHDGGESWKQVLLPRVEGDTFQSDPALAWTSDGTAWATAIGVEATEFTLRLQVFKSTDGGATWSFDATVSGDHDQADRQMIWADTSAGSPFKDNLYVVWHNGPRIYVNRRTGPGGSWGQPLRVSGGETGFGIGSDVKTNAAGHAFAFWPDPALRRVFVSKSTNGGASFAKAVRIASTFDAFTMAIPAQYRRGAPIYVSGGAFQRGSQSLVYAVWTDLTGAAGCKTFLNEPRQNVDSSCKTRIWFSRSTNGGARWQKARMINNQATKNDQMMPALAVDETTGALALIYFDTVGEARTDVNVWYQSSFNDGATWNAPVKVTSAPSNMSERGSDFEFGDYSSLSGIAGTFFPSWTDRRGPDLEKIWTVKITDEKKSDCVSWELTAEDGVASVIVPADAAESRLSIWHRQRFASGLNGGTLAVSVDGGPALAVPAAAILSGAGGGEDAVFKGMDTSPVNTVVDLDALCNAAVGGTAGCAGRALRLVFSAGDQPAETPDRWLLDEVSVTACRTARPLT